MKNISLIFSLLVLSLFLFQCKSPTDNKHDTSPGKHLIGTVRDSLTGFPIVETEITLRSTTDTLYKFGPVYSDSGGNYYIFAGGGGGADSYIEAKKASYKSKRFFYSDSLINKDTVSINFQLVAEP